MSNEKNLGKFLDSDDEGMIIMGLSMAKGFKLSDKILPKILGFYFWSDNTKIRSASRNLFFQNATEECASIIKDNWEPKIRTLKKAESVQPLLIKLAESIKGTSLNSLELFAPGLKEASRSYPDKRTALIPIFESNFGLSSETLLFKLAKSPFWDLQKEALTSLGRIGNLQTALKLYKLKTNYGKGLSECVKILAADYQERKDADVAIRQGVGTVEQEKLLNTKIKVKEECYTTNKKELDVIEDWLNTLIVNGESGFNASRDLAHIAYQILENAGKPKFDICKLAINGPARDYAFDELSNINTPECLDLILNLPYNEENFFGSSYNRRDGDNIDRILLYTALDKLHHLKKNKEKIKDMLVGLLNKEMNRSHYGNVLFKGQLLDLSDYKLPIQLLETLSNYKETKIVNSLITMLPKICTHHIQFSTKFIEFLKGLSTKSDDCLINSLTDLEYDPLNIGTGNTTLFYPDKSRSIYVSLLAITEDFERLDFFLDKKDFSFNEKSRNNYSFLQHSYMSVNDGQIALNENEKILYKKARKSKLKDDILLLIKEMVGSHHYVYKSYHTKLSNKDSRKFLYSEDSATRMMGLSLSKGNKFPEPVKPIILSISLFDSDETVREKAAELVKKFDIQNLPIPSDLEFLFFLSNQPESLFKEYWNRHSRSHRSDSNERFKNFLDNLISLNDERLVPFLFKLFEILRSESEASHTLKLLASNYPSKTYTYIANFMEDSGGLKFRDKKETYYGHSYRSYTDIVTDSNTSFRYQLMIENLPSLADSSFKIEPLVEFAYNLRLDSKEETSKAWSARRRITNQLDLFETTVNAASKLDVSSVISILSKKKLSTIPERTTFAHFLNIMYLYSKNRKGQEYTKACLKIKELAEPHLRDRSIHVRNYLKPINE